VRAVQPLHGAHHQASKSNWPQLWHYHTSALPPCACPLIMPRFLNFIVAAFLILNGLLGLGLLKWLHLG
jgi:hypothetical protein